MLSDETFANHNRRRDMKPMGRKLPVLFASVATALSALFPGSARAAEQRVSAVEKPSIVERVTRIREATQADPNQQPALADRVREALSWVNWGNWGNWGNWDNWRDWRNAWGNYWGNY